MFHFNIYLFIYFYILNLLLGNTRNNFEKGKTTPKSKNKITRFKKFLTKM